MGQTSRARGTHYPHFLWHLRSLVGGLCQSLMTQLHQATYNSALATETPH